MHETDKSDNRSYRALTDEIDNDKSDSTTLLGETLTSAAELDLKRFITFPYSGRDSVKSLRSSCMGLYPQRQRAGTDLDESSGVGLEEVHQRPELALCQFPVHYRLHMHG